MAGFGSGAADARPRSPASAPSADADGALACFSCAGRCGGSRRGGSSASGSAEPPGTVGCSSSHVGERGGVYLGRAASGGEWRCVAPAPSRADGDCFLAAAAAGDVVWSACAARTDGVEAGCFAAVCCASAVLLRKLLEHAGQGHTRAAVCFAAVCRASAFLLPNTREHRVQQCVVPAFTTAAGCGGGSGCRTRSPAGMIVTRPWRSMWTLRRPTSTVCTDGGGGSAMPAAAAADSGSLARWTARGEAVSAAECL